MSKQEDGVPTSSPYSWTVGNALSIAEFLAKYKPSMVENDGTKPWLWVQGGKLDENAASVAGELEAVAEASIYLEEVTKRIENIKNDDSIPARSSKKTGAKGKKEVREAVQAEATEKLKEIAVRTGYVNGKWLIFASADRIDMIWSAIATSIVSGPLSNTPAYLTKVATSPPGENPNHQHLICIYIPDVYNQVAVMEVMKVLLRNHGVNLSGVKSDLYTVLGIDSKHPSGISSTIWKNTSLMKDTEMKALKDEYFAELAAKKAAPPPLPPTTASATGEAGSTNAPDASVPPTKPKLKLKKKATDDLFASDDEDGPAKPKSKEDKKSTMKPPSLIIGSKVGLEEGVVGKRTAGSSSSLKKRKQEDLTFAGDEEEGEEEGNAPGKTSKTKPPSKTKPNPNVAPKKASAGKKKAKPKKTSEIDSGEDGNDDDGEEKEQERPKRKRAAKRSLDDQPEEEDDQDAEAVAEKSRSRKKSRAVKKS